MLELTDVSVSYGKIQALRDVSLNVKQGELVTLIGPNGAGKTTTLETIAGALTPDSGRITYHSDSIEKWSPEDIVSSGISLCPEGQRVFPEMTVRDNLILGSYTARKDAEERVESILELFPRLRERVEYSGSALSGGERQMLAIGRSLMTDPEVLLLDEPSHGLAPQIVKDVSEAILELNAERDVTILLVEQNAQMAFSIADRGYVIENGQIKESGSIDELKQSKQVRESYLGNTD